MSSSDRELLLQARQMIQEKNFDAAKEILHNLPENETAQQWLAKIENAASDPDRAKLAQAANLIKARQYDEARTLLQTIAHLPKAQEALERLDKIVAADADAPAPAVEAVAPPKPTPPRVIVDDEPPPFAGLENTPADIRQELLPQAGARRQLPQVQLGPVMSQIESGLKRANVDVPVAIKVLVVAAIWGLLAALLDSILGLPWGVFPMALGWLAAALNGPTYAIFRGKVDRAGWLVAAVAGLVTMLVWFIGCAIFLGDYDPYKVDDSMHHLYRYWFDELMNLPKAVIGGALIGLFSYGWYALLPRLPDSPAALREIRLPRRKKDTE